jgi:uncharacterized protein YfaS (alpha-2-macroglobulin family)
MRYVFYHALQNMCVHLQSPSNMTLGRRTFTSTSSSGFYQTDFSLPSNPEIGTWTARAFYGGQVIIKMFRKK